MAQNNESNAGLYFIVGALVVAVALMGFMFMGGEGDMNNYEPAAGIERAADNAGESVEKTTNSFSLDTDSDGDSEISTSTTTSD